jgi:hypothetical protein
MRSIYSIKLELLLDLRIRIKQVNLFELKLNLSITLIKKLKLIIETSFLSNNNIIKIENLDYKEDINNN